MGPPMSWGDLALMNKADRAFLRYLNPSPADTVVDLWYGDADLARAVAAQVPTGQLVLLMPDATAKTMAEHDLSGVHNVTVMVAAGAESLPVARFDLVYLAVRPYLSNARLADLLSGARRCLRPGGRLLLFASMRQGAPTLLRRAEEVFGNMQILDKPGGTRIARCYAPEDADASIVGREEWEKIFTVHTRGHAFSFVSGADVFSTGELDDGTRLLLESVDVMSADRVADLGCGYGAIGIIAARLANAGWTTMVDTSAHAVAFAQRNIVCNEVLNADAFVSDGLVAVRERRFDLVLSNPPLHVARGTVERLTREAYAQLAPYGRLAYVVHKGYDARSIVQSVFGKVTTLAETEAFRLIGANR